MRFPFIWDDLEPPFGFGADRRGLTTVVSQIKSRLW